MMQYINDYPTPRENLYERDFYAWTQATIDLINSGQFNAVDWENLTEELEALGRSEKGQSKVI